jgi:hypothetical protein
MLLAGVLAVVGAVGPVGTAAGQSRPGVRPGGSGASEPVTFESAARAELERNMRRLATEPAKAVRGDLEKLFDLCVAYGAIDQDASLLVDVAAARRMALHLSDPKNAAGPKVTGLLLANKELMTTLAMAVRPEDDVAGAYGILEKLAERWPQDVADRAGFGELVAAVCVVYDKPPEHPTLEQGGASPTGASPARVDPLEVFEFFKGSWGRLMYRDRLPAELLTHMVDVHSSVEDLRWAQKAYAGNMAIGKVYSSIVYDTASFKFGRPKKVFKDGYTLRNIKKVGGVCAEQAYFASEAAKAIGVPSVFITGEGADVGHAWVGYLKNVGNRSAWDLTEGRFGDYKTLQGRVDDAHTGKETTDAAIALTEWMVAVPRAALRAAGARTDAAARLAQATLRPGDWPPAWPGGEAWGAQPPGNARAADAPTALAMLRGALASCAGYLPAWGLLGAWADKGMLDGEAKKEWGDLVMKIAGRDRPDFAMAMLTPMIRSCPTAQEQSKLWDWAAAEFHHRPDLVSAARLAQGECWEKAGDSAKAWEAYKDVIDKFANDGRSVLAALARGELLLHNSGKDASVLGLYEDAFRRTSRPSLMSPGFETASNYYRVGFRYAQLLDGAGRGADAKRVRKQIGAPEKPEGPNG